MENSTSGPVLYCAFVACICAYWPLFMATDWAIRRLFPVFYDRLEKEDRDKKLIPVIMMTIRVLLGVGISLPTCVYAGYTTPPGINQPLSVAGQVCVASQTTVWATEIRIVMHYSNELFVHHIICLLITINAILSPSIHQVKPLYIYFAAQMGDLGPAAIIITKMTGRKPDTSKLLYYIALASTSWLILGKCGATGTSLGLALQNPYRIGDWVWAFCLSFFCLYSLYGAYRNLKWLQILTPDDERCYSTVFMNKVRIHASHLWLGIAFGTTLVSTLFVYGLYSTHEVTRQEISTVAIQGLIAASIGLTSAIVLQLGYQAMFLPTDLHGRDLYLQYGLICAAGWITYASRMSKVVDESTILAAVAFNVPLFEAITRVGHYYSAKEQSTQPGREVFLPNHEPEREPLLSKNSNSMTAMCYSPFSVESTATEKKPLTRSRLNKSLPEKPPAYAEIENPLSATTSFGSTTSQENFADESSIGERSSDEETPKQPATTLVQEPPVEPSVAKKHLGMFFSNLLVYCLFVECLFLDLLNLSDAARLAVAATVLTQLLRSPGMILAALRDAHTPVVLHALLTAVVTVLEGIFALYSLFAISMRTDSYSQMALKVAALTFSIAAGRLMQYLLRPNENKPRKEDQSSKEKASSIIFNMWTFTFAMSVLLQAINIREVMRDPSYMPTEDLPVGWRNFRMALTSPITWVGAVYMVGLPVIGLGVLNL